MSSVELILAEFGERQNAGDAVLDCGRFDPTLTTMRKFFPDLRVRLYTDVDVTYPGIQVERVEPPFNRKHDRFGWRANDYYKGFGLLASNADTVIAMDSDMVVISPDVTALEPLAAKFGLCIPVNTRWLVKRDAASTCDGGPVEDATRGMGTAYAGTPLVLGGRKYLAELTLQYYLRELVERPCRGPLAMWRAVYDTGYAPYILPPQYCVCAGMEGIENPIILHVGHDSVRTAFAGKW